MKHSIYITISMFALHCLQASEPVPPALNMVSKSVFVPRQFTTNKTLALALTNYQFYHPNYCSPEEFPFVTIYGSYFHQKSTNAKKLATYFLPQHKQNITIAEDGTGDIGSLWLNLISPSGNFLSTFTLRPQRTVDGAFFALYADGLHWGIPFWMSISFAVARVHHALRPKETIQSPSGELPLLGTAIQALNNPEWCFGKISPHSLSKTHVDDIQFKLGYNYFFTNGDHLGAYFTVTAPTGKGTYAHYLFEPLVGSHHPTIGGGFNYDVALWYTECQAIHWMTDFSCRFAVPAWETRSFDSGIRGEWSRYILIASETMPEFSLPGINIFTQKVRVHPRTTFELWTAGAYNYNDFVFELGYDLWWRQREKISCLSPLPNVGIYDLAANCKRPLISASTAAITTSILGTNIAPSDTTFTAVEPSDFNKRSAVHPHALTNTVYAAAAYAGSLCGYATMLGLGGSYEIAHRNTALQQWSFWIKAALGY